MNSFVATGPMGSPFADTTAQVSLFFIIVFLILPSLGGVILRLTAKWNILEKAGEPGWTALIPFYGNYMFYDITWDNGWYSLASYIPGVGFVFHVTTMVKLSCRFAKNSVFAAGLVLFEPVFLAILGFDDSEFIG